MGIVLSLLLESQGLFGVEIEAEEGHYNYFIKDKCAYNYEDEAEELKPVKILFLAVDTHYQEEDPNE